MSLTRPSVGTDLGASYLACIVNRLRADGHSCAVLAISIRASLVRDGVCTCPICGRPRRESRLIKSAIGALPLVGRWSPRPAFPFRRRVRAGEQIEGCRPPLARLSSPRPFPLPDPEHHRFILAQGDQRQTGYPRKQSSSMESMLNQAKQLCPFIKSSSTSTLRHLSTGRKNGKSLLTRAGYNCPVMRKALVQQSRRYVVPTRPVHAQMPTLEQVHLNAGVLDTSRGMFVHHPCTHFHRSLTSFPR